MVAINTNVASLNTQAALAVNQRSNLQAMEQLSTGKRINSASDDAAGLAISIKFKAQVQGLNQSVRNANDGISMIQTAEAAANSATTMLQRMRELAVQAANGTYSSSDRANLNTEFGNLTSEITRVANVTTWNGTTLGVGKSIQIQVGPGNTASTNVVTVSTSTLSATGLGVNSSAITSQNTALAAISSIDAALNTIATSRANLGARINRFQFTEDQLNLCTREDPSLATGGNRDASPGKSGT